MDDVSTEGAAFHRLKEFLEIELENRQSAGGEETDYLAEIKEALECLDALRLAVRSYREERNVANRLVNKCVKDDASIRADLAKVTAERDEAIADAKQIAETNLHAAARIDGLTDGSAMLREALATAQERIAEAQRARGALRQIVRDQVRRMREAGESHEMLSRWICDAFDAARLQPEAKKDGEQG